MATRRFGVEVADVDVVAAGVVDADDAGDWMLLVPTMASQDCNHALKKNIKTKFN